MSQDRPLLGIGLMLGFCIVAPVGDAIAKLLGTRVDLGEVLLFRFAIQSLVLIPLVAVTGRAWRMSGRVLWLAALRTGLLILGISTMFTALKFVPLADAVAIAFVMPFIMLLLGYLFLQEEIGPHRLLACGVGFVGTLLVIQPSFRDVGYYALLPLGVAVIFSFFILTTRKIAKQTDPIGLQAVNGVMATGVLLPVVLAGNFLAVPGLTLSASTGQDFSLLLGIGLVGTLAHLLMTWSLRFAPSASVAPMQYLEIPVATAIGLVIFGDLPNTLASAGIAVTVAAGLYVVSYEHLGQWRRARSFAPPSIPPSRRPKPVAAE